MTLKLSQSQVDALGFDLHAAVATFVELKRAHAATIDQPAPSAHPLVEEIVSRHAGAFELIDDKTPADRRYELMRQVVEIAQERVNAVLSPARQNLAVLDVQVLVNKAERTAQEEATLVEAQAKLGAIAEIQRHAAVLGVELDELPDPELTRWAPYGWPAL